MAFEERVSQIKAALQDLVQNLNVADTRVEKFASELGSGAQGAASYRELADVIKRFSDNLRGIDTGRLTEAQNGLRAIQQNLNALSATGPNKITAALEQQARVLREIGQLQGTLRVVGTAPTSPAQQIFQSRQQAATELLQQRYPAADADRVRRLAADLAEGIQDDRYRLGGGIRVRTPQLSQELEALSSSRSITTAGGVNIGTSLQSYREQLHGEDSASLIAQQAKLEDATRRRAAEIDSLNNIDSDYAAAQKRHTDIIEAASRAEKEAQEAALKEAVARREAAEVARGARIAPYQEQLGQLSGTAQRLLGASRPGFAQGQGDLLGNAEMAKLERQAQLFDRFNREVQSRTLGKEQLRPEGFSTQSYLDLNSGITKIVGQGQLLDGTFINLNGHMDQNGKLTADLGTRYNGLFQTLGKNVVKVAEFAFATELVYGSIRKVGEAFHTVISVQDELTQISFTIKEMGANADQFTQSFLKSGIQAGITTGQGFEESIQTQLAAFRLTAGEDNLPERQRITKQLTELQLGTQTAFGLSKEQSIDSVGVIFRQIVDGGESAGQAVGTLTTLLDKFTVAAQNSGVKGSELVQTFAGLVGASKELNISQNDLVALTAAFAQTTNKSPKETETAIKTLAERIYGEGAQDLNDIGIATQEIDPETKRIRNRQLVDILQDAYVKSLESETASLQISQAIGAQRRAPEAAALVRTVPVFQELQKVIEPVGTQDGATGQFQGLVVELNKNLIPTLNRLSLTFDEVIAKILIDGGALDDIIALVKLLTSALRGLSDIENPGVFEAINTSIKALLLGLGYLGVSQVNTIRNLSRTFIQLGESIRSATVAQRELITVQQTAAIAGPSIAPGINAAGGVGNVPYGPVEAKPFLKPETLAKLRSALVGIGTVAIPVAYELATSDESNLEKYTNVGSRIAGGLVGFMVGGPGGALVGQEIGKAISDYLDVAGIFGESEAEKQKFILGGSQLTGSEYSNLQAVPRDRIEQLREVLKSNVVADPTESLGGLFGGVYGQESDSAFKKLQPQLQFLGVDSSALQKLAQANPGASVDELITFLQELNIAGSKARTGVDSLRKSNPVEEYPDESRFNRPTKATIGPSDQANVITETTEAAVSRIEAAVENQIKSLESRFNTPYNQAQFGPGGLQQQNLQSQLLSGKIDAEQYKAGTESLQNLPEILGQAIPLFQELGLSSEGLVQKLYEAGPAGQQSFQSILEPLIQAYTTEKEYALLQEQRIQLNAQLALLDPDSAQAKSLKEKIALLEQELALRQASAQAAQQYIGTAVPGLTSFLQNFSQIQQKATVIKGSKGTAAQFQAPSLFDASDYSIDQISKALDQTREKQAQLVKLFPEYAREFAKQQQFVLDNGAGGFKPVGGINQQFFSQFLQQQKSQLQKPDLVDLSQYSDDKVGQILQRAAQLQGRAVELAPDLAQDAEKSRLLILKKNNDLLAQNGLSQDFLRVAIDELTKTNEDMLRGHFNLPADYRAPTIFDYYDSGGREKGSVNYPRPGGDANLDLAQKIADAIISSQNKAAGQGGADLSQLGNTIEPGSRPIGYPNPGSPGTPDRIVAPPALPNYDQFLPKETTPDAVDRYLKTSQSGFGTKDSEGSLRKFDAAIERNERRLAEVESKFDGLSTTTQKTTDAFSGITSLYTGAKTTISRFTEGFDTFISRFAPKELGPLIRSSFLQGLQQIPPGAVVLQITLNGQPIPTQQAKVTIGTTGGGGQSLGATSPTQRGRPQ